MASCEPDLDYATERDTDWSHPRLQSSIGRRGSSQGVGRGRGRPSDLSGVSPDSSLAGRTNPDPRRKWRPTWGLE